MRNFLLLTLSICCLLCGCASPEKTAYRTIGSIVLTVNTAKHVYEDQRVALKITPETDAIAKDVYKKYQATLKVAEDLEKSIRSTPDEASRWNTAISAVTASANDFIGLVQSLVPSARLTLVK